MRMVILMLLLTALTGSLVGQNLTYDFTTEGVSIKEWRSVLGQINERNYTIPHADSLTSEGLILKSGSGEPAFLEIVSDVVILPGWKGDILESHEPYYVKYATSKMKMTLRGATSGDVLASERTEVKGTSHGSANLLNVECSDPKGCYFELILWSHDTIESTPLNRLKEIEIRSASPIAIYDFSKHGLALWTSTFGELSVKHPKESNDAKFAISSVDGSSSSLKWTSKSILSYGWRGDILETHAPENSYWAGNVAVFLKGHSTGSIFAQAISRSGGKPLANANLEDVECNDRLGCYIEVEISCGEVGGPAIQNELKTIQLVTKQDADDYDVGIFYMPFWHNDWGTSYWDSSDTRHRWYIMDRYNQAMEEQGLTHYVKKPLNIYRSEISPESYYNEEDPAVNIKQLTMMKDYGIDYVIYDSFFQYYKMSKADTIYDNKKWAPFWNGVVKNVSQLDDIPIPFSVMWANDFTSMVFDHTNPDSRANPRGCRGFFEPNGGLDRLLNHWDTLLNNPNYKTINGKPAFYVYYSGTHDPALGGYTNSLEGLCGYCTDDPFFDAMGPARYESGLHARKTAFFLEKIEERLNKEIFFVAAISAGTAWQDPLQKLDWYLNYPTNGGFDAVTTYGLSAFDGTDLFTNGKWWNWDYSYNYDRMVGVYAKYYNFLLENNYSTLTTTNLKFHIPVTAGFNRGPLNMHENKGAAENGYAFAVWDQAISTPSSFESALNMARSQVDQYPNQTARNVTLCCWNEYAEGTVIEPTTTWGYSYLEKVKEVFSEEEEEPFDETGLRSLEVPEIGEENTGESLEADKKDVVIQPVLLDDKSSSFFSIYPNPVERTANIRFKVNDKTSASIQILNALGQVVQELINETVDSGTYEVEWDATSRPKGFYFCRIVTNDVVEVRKLILTH